MSNNHKYPLEDIDGNILFNPNLSNINDISLIKSYWDYIINKPSFCNICFTSSYNDLINKPILSSVAITGDYNDLINKPWINSNFNIYNINSYVGIGTTNPKYNLDVYGDINFNGNIYQNGVQYQNSQWITSNSNIYYNLGNIGIGKSNDINEILEIDGNIRINGNIYPNSNEIFDLGSSNYRWKDLYLSGNSIYLNDIIISKDSNDNIDIKDKNNNYKGLNINSFTINSNNNKISIEIDNEGKIVYNSNNNYYYQIILENEYDNSNIVYSNVLIDTSNDIYSKIKSITTDNILSDEQSSNRFIINDIYDRNITFTKNIYSSNIITSNLTIIGEYTIFNTPIYQTNNLEIYNDFNNVPLIIRHNNSNYNIAEFYNNSNIVFLISSNSNIGINTSNPLYNLDINGSLNTRELFIKGVNISNIIDNKILSSSNILIDYNTHINLPQLSAVAINGDYNNLINIPWINSNNNIYNFNNENIGIGISNPKYKLDVNGEINTKDLLIKGANISNIIDEKIIITSNKLIDYNNHINLPSLYNVSLSGSYYDINNRPNQYGEYSNYNNLININWINDNNNIYINNINNIGIGTDNPQYKLDINGEINVNELFIKELNISNIIDNKFLINSNILIDYYNHINLPNLSIFSTTGNYIDLINIPNLSYVALNGDYNDLINKPWLNSNNNIYNSNINNIGIGIENPKYKLDINGEININEIFIKENNISNIINYKNSIFSNIINSNIINLSTDNIYLGSNNKFIINDIYINNINISKNLYASNIITSNLNVIGDITTFNTNVYITKNMEIINENNFTCFVIKHINSEKNVLEIYNNSNNIFIINSNKNIGINNINPKYNLDINGSLNTYELFINNYNISNIIDDKIFITSNKLINYNNLINIPKLSSISLYNDYNNLINIPWLNSNNNIYNSNIGNIGIGIYSPKYKLDINGDMNTNEIFIKDYNISNIINNKIIITSNYLIEYSNHINLPYLSKFAITGDYNDLINKPTKIITDYYLLSNITWKNSNNNIYNCNINNIGIGKSNPLYKLDINGDININGSLLINNSIIPISFYSNTNIISSNTSLNYKNNSNYGYYIFLTNSSIFFPQQTYCDIIVIGAGGNGGNDIFSGGGGAGELIYYPNYQFNSGIYNIKIGYSSFNSNDRISKISSNSIDYIIAKGGNDGKGIFVSINNTSNNINLNNSTLLFNYTNISNINNGTYNITFSSGSISINSTPYIIDKSYPILIDNNGNNINPIAWYKFDSNGLTIDSSGNGYTLTAYSDNSTSIPTLNTTDFIKGNGSASFNKNNANFFRLLNPFNFYNVWNDKGISISFWFKYTIYGSNPRIFTINSGNYITYTYGTNFLEIYNYSITEPKFLFNIGNKNIYLTLNNSKDNWTHCCITISKNQEVKIYINNVLINITQSCIISNINVSTFSIGRGWASIASAPNDYYTGLLDDIRFYNITLNSIQVSELYNGRVQIIQESVLLGGGSGGGSFLNINNQTLAGTKWNSLYSYSTNGSNGSSLRGGNGGSATSNGGFIEPITGSNLILGIGGLGATSNSIPILNYSYGCGGDGNGGLGTQGIVIVKVPLNIVSSIFNGFVNYSNIINRPYLNELFTSRNFIDIGYYNQVNFPLGDISFSNEWFLYMGTSPTNINNSFIFWHLNSNINSKWWFNGTISSTNNEISDIRIKKEITDITNPLEKLMLIEPKEYMLCDEKDYLKKYGIIAQQVKEVFPDFVYTDEDYIANIYTNGIYKKDYINKKYIYKIIFNIDITDKINVNDEIKILLNNNNNQEIIIEDLPYHNRYKKRYIKVKSIIDNKTIELENDIEIEENEKNNIFIYGKKVKDFLKLDYSSIYTLNIAFNQELYKYFLKQKEKISYLNNRISFIENILFNSNI